MSLISPHKNISPRAKRSLREEPASARVIWHLVDELADRTGADVIALAGEGKSRISFRPIFSAESRWRLGMPCANYGAPLVHTLREYYLRAALMSLNRRGVECEGRCVFCLRICAVLRRAAFAGTA